MYEYLARVAPSQVDADGLQTLVSLVSLMQDCSQLWLDSEPVLAWHLKETEGTMLLATRQVEVCRWVPLGEHERVVTSVYKCNKRMGYRNTFVYGEDGLPVAKCHCTGVFVDAQGRPGGLTPEVVASLTLDPERAVDLPKDKIHVPDEQGEVLDSLQALTSDIDFNCHVNNAQYVRMAIDVMPKLARSTRLRIEYRQPAHVGGLCCSASVAFGQRGYHAP